MSLIEIIGWVSCGVILLGIIIMYRVINYYDQPADKETK